MLRVKRYFQHDFSHDLLAGVVVGLVALPLAIAFAIASGAAAEQGLYSAIIAGGVMALLSGSKYQVSGPTGAFIVILLGIVNQYGIDGLLVSGFLAGVMLVIMGVFHFGSAIKFIPYPVTVGFTAGIGVIIFSGQIKDFLGLTFTERPHGFVETLRLIGESIGNGIHTSSLIIGAVTIAVFLFWRRFIKKFPPAPAALAAGICVSFFLPDVLTIGDIPSGLPKFQMLNLSFENIVRLLPPAFAITMLGGIESLLSAVVADGMTGTKHNSNQELIAQGIGNMIVPFFGGIPATGAIARTATNINNGARTQMSGFYHALVLLAIMLIFAPYARYIPLAALAGILMMVAYMMSDVPHFVRLFKAPRQDIVVLLLTFLTTVFVDLVYAVIGGVLLASLLFIKRMSEIHIAALEDHVKAGTEGSTKLHASVKKYPQILLYEIAGPLFFGAASIMLDRIPMTPGKILILRMKHVTVIDSTALHALEVIIDDIHKKGGKVILSTVHSEVRHLLDKNELIKKMGGADFVTASSTDAIEMAKKLLGYVVEKS